MKFSLRCSQPPKGFRAFRRCPLYRAYLRLSHENRRLRDLSMLDPLTGLYNMRSFFRILEAEMHKTRRSRTPISLIMLDLDHFKEINDSYGHTVGDYVLKSVADTLRTNVRAGDMPCRYGGEEFAIILPDTSLNQAIGVAKRLKEAIEKMNCIHGGKEIPVTASFGVASYKGLTMPDVIGFVDRADQCLLEAKQNGRNRVVWEGEEPKIEVSSEEKELLKGAPSS